MSNVLQKSVSLIGYGVSNRAMFEYFKDLGITPIVRTPEKLDIPHIKNIYGKNYLLADEDLVVRSPSVRPDTIITNGIITSEAKIALSILKSHKIGVTGSDGKSTVSTLISKMLSADKKENDLCGNIGFPIIETVKKSKKDKWCVCELSSFQLFDLCPQLDCAVITNITENHLNWHKSMDEYIGAKTNILKNSKRAVLPFSLSFLANPDRENVIVCDRYEDVKKVKNAHTVTYFDDFIRYNGEKIVPISKIALKGEFNKQNIAFAIGALYGTVSHDAINYVANTFDGIKHRMKFVDTIDGISFFDSSVDSTPSRTGKTLSAFDKSKTVLILGGYDKNLTYDCLFEITKGLKGVIICGENKEKIFTAVNGNNTPVYVSNDFEDSIKTAYKMAEKGDSVLLSPASASFDMFENYVKRAEKFIQTVKEIKNERDKKDS